MGIAKRKSRAEQADLVKTRLLAAARTVFLRDGYHGATLDAVVKVAGFTKGVVYSRYTSKAELFLALLEARVEERVEELGRARGTNPGDALYQQWLARHEADEAWTLLVLEFRIAAARDPELNARYAAIHDRVVEGVRTRIAGASLALPAEQVARIGLALANGLALERAVAGARLPASAARTANAALFEALAK